MCKLLRDVERLVQDQKVVPKPQSPETYRLVSIGESRGARALVYELPKRPGSKSVSTKRIPLSAIEECASRLWKRVPLQGHGLSNTTQSSKRTARATSRPWAEFCSFSGLRVTPDQVSTPRSCDSHPRRVTTYSRYTWALDLDVEPRSPNKPTNEEQ